MQEVNGRESDNLSDLETTLKAIEGAHVEVAVADRVVVARRSLFKALGMYKASRLELGRALHAYRKFFKARRGWTAVMEAIAWELGCDSRTAHRIIEGYELASKLPAATLEALKEDGIDATAERNARLVGMLIEMPVPRTREEAQEAIDGAILACDKGKASPKQTEAAPATSLDDFTERIVKSCEAQIKSLTPEQKQLAAQYFVESLAAHLRVDLSQIRSYSRPSEVRMPRFLEAA
jgi:hypothetical protein